jgi:hypothetical protein
MEHLRNPGAGLRVDVRFDGPKLGADVVRR